MNSVSAHSPTVPPLGLEVLVVEPDENVGAEIISALEGARPGTKISVARSLEEAQELVVDQKPALFVLDVDATYDLGQEFLYDLRTSHPNARAIILTDIHFTAQREQVAGLGAIHFLEKPFPRTDFMALVEALLAPGDKGGERFQGTLSDLHIADIIQLKCISGATSMLEFTGPRGEKARVYFENGQVRHASAPGKEGLAAFHQIVDWTGGVISEVPVPPGTPHTINLEWQVLLMEAVRTIDESRNAETQTVASPAPPANGSAKIILVIDDSAMLLSFVKEILDEQNYRVLTAPNATEGLEISRDAVPDLILLDFVLPDMKGDEVCRRLIADPATAEIPVVYVSGFGSDLQPDRSEIPNVIGSISKPFTSETLVGAVRNYLGEEQNPLAEVQPVTTENLPPQSEVGSPLPTPWETAASAGSSEKPQLLEVSIFEAATADSSVADPISPEVANFPSGVPLPESVATTERTVGADPRRAYFCGDSSFFSLHAALQTIARERLTGALYASWAQHSVELWARDGAVVAATARESDFYCEEVPAALSNVERERIETARARQAEDGCPIFVLLVQEGLVSRESGIQFVHYYGQKLFSHLWTNRVRFTFEPQELPEYAHDLPSNKDSIDQWALGTLRFLQYQELGPMAEVEVSSVPAYTRDGSDRVQDLRLTAPEAEFASQFNGSRSILQISENLQLDLKLARLALFRFLALEIVECWPAQVSQEAESHRGIRGMFGR